MSDYGILKAKEKFKLFLSKVSAVAYGNGRLQECKNTEFVWELKRGFVKAVVGTTVRSRDRPLSELGMKALSYNRIPTSQDY